MSEHYLDWYEGNWGSFASEDPKIDDGLPPLENDEFDAIVQNLNILGSNWHDGSARLIIELTENLEFFPFDLCNWYWRTPDDFTWQEADYDTAILNLDGTETLCAVWTFACEWGGRLHNLEHPEIPSNGVEIALDYDWILNQQAEMHAWQGSLAFLLGATLENPRKYSEIWELGGFEFETEVSFPTMHHAQGSRDIVGIESSRKLTPEYSANQSVFLRPLPHESWLCRESLVAQISNASVSTDSHGHVCALHNERQHSLYRFLSATQEQVFKNVNWDELKFNSKPSRLLKEWQNGHLKLGTPRDWQIAALKAWEAHARHGVIEAATGSGKSHIGLLAAMEALEDGLAVVVVVPTIALQDQWVNIFASQHIPTLRLGGGGKHTPRRCQVLIAVQPSFNKLMTEERLVLPPALLIADEVHNYGGKTSSAVLSPQFSRRLGLTATLIPSESNLAIFYNYFSGPPVFEHSFQAAVEDGSICPFELTIARCDMDGTAYIEYQNLRAKLISTHEELVSRGVIQARERLSDLQLELLKSSDEFGDLAETVIRINSEIDRALSRLNSTTRAMSEVAPIIRGNKGTIIFSDTTQACDEVLTDLRTFRVSIQRITSQVTGSERSRILKDVGLGWIDAVVSPRVLDEGVDIQNIHTAIFVGGSRRKLQLIQRMGRALRTSKGKEFARIVFLVAKGSDDDPLNLRYGSPMENSELKFIFESSLHPVNIVDVDVEGELQSVLGDSA